MPISKHFLKHKLFRTYLLTLLSLFLVFFGAWLGMRQLPQHKALLHLLLAEDQLMESIALGFLVSAFCLTLFTLIRSLLKKYLVSPFWWIFPLGVFLLIGDETSFGRVYSKWYEPPKLCDMSVDALHDLLMIFPHCLYGAQAPQSFLLFVTLALLACVLTTTGALLYRKRRVLIASFKENPVWIYLALAFIIFWLGGGIDIIGETHFIKVKNNNFFVFLEETLELFAECTIFFAALAFYQITAVSKPRQG